MANEFRISQYAKRSGHYDDYVIRAIFVICYSTHQSRAEDRRGGSRRHRSWIRRDQFVSVITHLKYIIIRQNAMDNNGRVSKI